MTSANVFNVGSVNQGQKLNANAATSKTKAGNSGASAVFASMMNVNYSTNPQANARENNTLVKNAKTDDTLNAYTQYRYQDHDIASNRINDKLDAATDDLNEFDQKIVADIAQALGVDEDTVRNAMENLGLTAFGLMEPQNLVQVVVQLTEVSSPEELLLQPEFVDLMQDMQGLQNELMNQLDLMPEEMQELIAQMDVVDNTQPMDQAQFAEVIQRVTQADDAQQPLTENVAVDRTAETSETELTQTVSEEGTDVNVSNVQTDDNMTQTGQQNESSNAENLTQHENEVHTADRTETQVTDHTPNMVLTSEQPVEEVVPTMEDESYLSVDAMDLIEQFAENVKTSISEGTSSMEMQLNPEHLGKVYLQISSKEGEIHAQIAANNEAVKNALETQVAELRESLNQAGVKVNSIEVTVASHEFERNLEQGQSREFEEGKRQQEQQSQRRNINLSSLDELSSMMTEEEALVAQIMKDNGNSVDLTA